MSREVGGKLGAYGVEEGKVSVLRRKCLMLVRNLIKQELNMDELGGHYTK